MYFYEGYQLINHVWEPIVPQAGDRLSYGDFKAIPKGSYAEAEHSNEAELYIMPEEMSGSDYSGGIASVSNHRVFLKEFGKVEGVYDVYGGYGTYAVAIRADVAEANEEIKSTLAGLTDYPLIDEEDWSNIGAEWQRKAMPDILRNIQRDLNIEEYIEDADRYIENDEILEELVWKAINELNLEWAYEYDSAYLSSDKVLPYIEDRILLQHCNDMPLLINRKWSCNQTQTMYEQKLKGVPDGQDSAP